jgi:hypothetical protein
VQPTVSPDHQSVFLNVPFDREYTDLFVTLIAALTGLGRKLATPSARAGPG